MRGGHGGLDVHVECEGGKVGLTRHARREGEGRQGVYLWTWKARGGQGEIAVDVESEGAGRGE